ncbi:MAG TPA: hypothetical protein VGS19_36555 [Streptosporangiaceae bacterium]|nr:hypothetical protein [Streptosporangiaceae bacterium]
MPWTATCGSSLTSGQHGATGGKPKHWVVSRYFGKFNRFRNDRWVFGDRRSSAYLLKFSWAPVIRHVMVKGAASPDDPALGQYWADRRRRTKPSLDEYTLRLLARQAGRCPLCREHLLTPDQHDDRETICESETKRIPQGRGRPQEGGA